MRDIFLLIFFISNIVNGQTNCHCDVVDFEEQKYVNFETDYLELFQLTTNLKKTRKPVCIFKALDLEFSYYLLQKNSKKANIILNEQENIFNILDCNSSFLNQLYVNKTKYYQLTNNLEKLSEFSFKALSQSEQLKNKKLELESLKAIVYLFMRLDKDMENWEYVKRAQKIITNFKNDKETASQYIWLAYEYESQYLETGSKSLIDSSYIFANTAKQIAKKYNLNRELAQSFRANEAIAYHKADLNNALKHIDSAIYYGKRVKGVFNLAPFYIAKAWDLVDLGQLKDASKCIDTSLLVDNKNDLGFSANVWHEAKEIYGITGDTAKAYKSFKVYTKLKDSLLNINRIKAANDVEAKYKSQLKDTKIENLSFLLIIAVVVIIIIFLIFNILRLRKTREKDKAIKEAYKEQLALEKELVNVRNTIAKDFHDDLGNKLAKITVLSDLMTIKEKSKEELKEALHKIKSDSDELYEGTKDFMFSLKSENDHLDEVITYLADFGTTFYNDLDIDFHLETHVNLNLKLPNYSNRQIILIFKEAMTNTAKHAQCSQVILSVMLDDNILNFQLKDNGIGFKAAHNSKKGILNMKQRANEIDADFRIISNERGSLIQLKYKLPNSGSTSA